MEFVGIPLQVLCRPFENPFFQAGDTVNISDAPTFGRVVKALPDNMYLVEETLKHKVIGSGRQPAQRL